MSDNLKRRLFRVIGHSLVESVLVYGVITWTLTSTLKKKVDEAYTRMLRTALNKTWTNE